MRTTTEIELKNLLQELENEPTNLDLINSVAIGYFENYDQKINEEDYDNFEKAYKIQKTVKSTHNFAWFLYFECSVDKTVRFVPVISVGLCQVFRLKPCQ